MSRPGLPIVLVHLGWPVPGHLGACVAQIRRVAGEEPAIVGPREGAALRSTALVRFRRKEQLSHLGMGGFWRYAAERFLVLEAFMREHGLERCLHLESDNLLYVDPHKLAPWLETSFGPCLATCPLLADQDTAAVFYVGSLDALSRFNDGLVSLVELPPERFLSRHGGAMATEMRMLHVLRADMDLARPLPTTISEARATASPWVFDPASYGQWVDGIPAKPGVPYLDAHHVPAAGLRDGSSELVWVDAVPLLRSDGVTSPLVNLHLHSKRLATYLPEGTDVSMPSLLPPRRRDGALAARLRRIHGRLVP
jgi:hypothetical protein